MTNQVIIPDINAKHDIDLVRLQIEDGVAVARAVLSIAKTPAEEKERKKDLYDAEEMLAQYKPSDDMPVIVIGYIPAPKLAYLRNASAEMSREERETEGKGKGKKPKPLTAKQLDALVDLNREFLQWGVKGHRNFEGYPWRTKTASAGGREYEIASDDCVEIYEQMGLLNTVSAAVAKFNFLDAKKKIKQPPTSTGKQETLTADDAPETNT